MLRVASREEVRKVGAPLHLLLNQASWPGNRGAFDILKNGASSIVAHLAYCAIGADERERRNRAKVVPCRVFQDLLVGEDFDFIETLRLDVDFQDVQVVRTKFYVAVVIPKNQFLLIGIRGTQFAYDWLINVRIGKGRGPNGEYLHAGYLREAKELASLLTDCLLTKYSARIAKDDCAVYLSGHSLGGAVAAILNGMAFPTPVNACYMFGTPRISGASILKARYQPFATRRDLDIIPHCPPKAFNYSNFKNQKTPSGIDYSSAAGLEMYFFASWLWSLALSQFPKNHSMERYRLEVLEIAKAHEKVDHHWKREEYEDIEP